MLSKYYGAEKAHNFCIKREHFLEILQYCNCNSIDHLTIYKIMKFLIQFPLFVVLLSLMTQINANVAQDRSFGMSAGADADLDSNKDNQDAVKSEVEEGYNDQASAVVDPNVQAGTDKEPAETHVEASNQVALPANAAVPTNQYDEVESNQAALPDTKKQLPKHISQKFASIAKKIQALSDNEEVKKEILKELVSLKKETAKRNSWPHEPNSRRVENKAGVKAEKQNGNQEEAKVEKQHGIERAIKAENKVVVQV